VKSQPKPYFREFDGWWYVQIRIRGKRKQIKLAKGRENEEEARRQYHRVMLTFDGDNPPPQPTSADAVVVLLDVYLGHCADSLSAASVEWYTHFLSSFGRFIGADLLVSELQPSHVTDWIHSKPKWSSTTKNGAVRAVRTCFRWLAGERRIPHYPLDGGREARDPRVMKPAPVRGGGHTGYSRRCLRRGRGVRFFTGSESRSRFVSSGYLANCSSDTRIARPKRWCGITPASISR
jgi:hypothetical protein